MADLAYFEKGESVDHTPAADLTAGTVTEIAGGHVGAPANDIAANALGSATVDGVFKVLAASATTWNDGDELWWDDSASGAIPKSLALDGSADVRLGRAVGAKVSGTTLGYVRLNDPPVPFDPVVYEFDADGANGDVLDHVLVPAAQNPNGLLILGIYGVLTEQMAGSSEDQGLVVVSDQSDNALATLTPSNAAADAVGDIIVGYSAPAAATGAVAVTVAAGEFIDGAVTQQTAGGTPAGKMKVYIVAVPLL